MSMSSTTRVVIPIVAIAWLASGCHFLNLPDQYSGEDAAVEVDAAPPSLEYNQEISALQQSRYVGGCDVETIDPDDSGTLDPGETTAGEPIFEPKKDICNEGVDLRYRMCMMEKMPDATTAVSVDYFNEEVCGDYVTELDCLDNQLVQGETRCEGGAYCQVTITPVFEAMECGWGVVEFGAYSKDGELLEEFTPEALEEFEVDLIEVPVQ